MSEIAKVVRMYPTEKVQLAKKLKNTINNCGCLFTITRGL